jgi:hypothetical protein
MTANDLILQFLDGSLNSEQEAEFMHILSVSPERRELLRSYMRQRDLFASDMQAITVPYGAEQQLWQRLGMLMPISDAAETLTLSDGVTESAPLATTQAGYWKSLATPLVTSVVAIALVLGIGIGYTVGNNGSSTVNTVTHWIDRPTTMSHSSLTEMSTSQHAYSVRPRGIEKRSSQNLSPTFIAALNLRPQFNSQTPHDNGGMSRLLINYLNNGPKKVEAEIAQLSSSPSQMESLISEVRPMPMQRSYAGHQDRREPLHLYAESEDAPTKSMLQRFEFSFLESFGRELPSSYSTNITMPILTNAAIGVYFQILPNSNSFWFGASGGAANFTRKHLTTGPGNPGDPFQEQMYASYSHTPANWAGAFLQYRLPLFTQADLTFTGGYGLSTAGTMTIGELGLHFDATRDVGFTFGLRGIELNYDLAQEEAATMKAARGPLVIPNGVANSSPSYNLEVNTGLFFHF